MELESIAFSVPGTIVNRISGEDSPLMWIDFCEDDFTDEKGIPYVMEGLVEKRLHPQNRIMVSYDEAGFRLIEPINGDNWTRIGVAAPDNVKNLDYIHAKKIMHRNALKLNQGFVSVSKKEVEDIAKRSQYKKGRFVVAGISCSVLWLMLIGLIVVFTFGEIVDAYLYPAMALLILGFVLWIVLSVLSMKACLKLPIKRLLKMRNRSEVLMMEVYPTVDMAGFKTLHVRGVEREGDIYEEVDYPVAIGCEVFLNEVKRGTILYRYFGKDNALVNCGSMFITKPGSTRAHTLSSDNS